MKFPAFAYCAPSSLEQAIDTLVGDPEAKVLAGGQSLLPLMALRLAQPSVLVDLGTIAGLATIDAADRVVRIGAGTTLAAVEDSEVVAQELPLLARAIRHVAHRPIRNRGTIGGSLAHADPSAELPAVAVALDATLIARGQAGERRIAAGDFFTGPLMTALADDEILTSIEFPVRDGGWSLQEVTRRAGDFAVAMAVVGLGLDNGGCTWSTIVLQGVGAKPIRMTEAEAALTGGGVDEEAVTRAASAATAALKPTADIHGSSEYRRRVAATLVRRAAIEAAGSAA